MYIYCNMLFCIAVALSAVAAEFQLCWYHYRNYTIITNFSDKHIKFAFHLISGPHLTLVTWVMQMKRQQSPLVNWKETAFCLHFGKRRSRLCTEKCVHVCYLGQFVAAFMLVKRRHGRLGWWTVQPLGSALHRIFWCPSLCDEQRQENEELLRIVLEKLLRCIYTRERDRRSAYLFKSLHIWTEKK